VLNQLSPQRVDNTYRGYKLALWLFALLVLMKGVIALNSIFNGYSVASSADGIPLDTFTPAGAQTAVSLFAILGLSRRAVSPAARVAPQQVRVPYFDFGECVMRGSG
jgi:hypothetical protein